MSKQIRYKKAQIEKVLYTKWNLTLEVQKENFDFIEICGEVVNFFKDNNPVPLFLQNLKIVLKNGEIANA